MSPKPPGATSVLWPLDAMDASWLHPAAAPAATQGPRCASRNSASTRRSRKSLISASARGPFAQRNGRTWCCSKMGSESTSESLPDPALPRGDYFVTTRWTVVLSAGRKSSPQSDRALGELCQTYWYPLYAYVRGRGHTKEDAEDLVQAFFARFLE